MIDIIYSILWIKIILYDSNSYWVELILKLSHKLINKTSINLLCVIVQDVFHQILTPMWHSNPPHMSKLTCLDLLNDFEMTILLYIFSLNMKLSLCFVQHFSLKISTWFHVSLTKMKPFGSKPQKIYSQCRALCLVIILQLGPQLRGLGKEVVHQILEQKGWISDGK